MRLKKTLHHQRIPRAHDMLEGLAKEAENIKRNDQLCITLLMLLKVLALNQKLNNESFLQYDPKTLDEDGRPLDHYKILFQQAIYSKENEKKQTEQGYGYLFGTYYYSRAITYSILENKDRVAESLWKALIAFPDYFRFQRHKIHQLIHESFPGEIA